MNSRPFAVRTTVNNISKDGSMTVKLGEALLDRVNKVAKALDKTQADYVREVLDKSTLPYQKEIGEIAQREAMIKKVYAQENENGQGTIRHGALADAANQAKKGIRNKSRKDAKDRGA